MSEAITSGFIVAVIFGAIVIDHAWRWMRRHARDHDAEQTHRALRRELDKQP